MGGSALGLASIIVWGGVLLGLILVLPSIRVIGATEVGLVTKRFAFRRLSASSPLAFRGEAGYQADLLMPGWRFKLWVVYTVDKHPWVQVPAGQIGVVIAQIGDPPPIGAKSGVYSPAFGDFTSLEAFIEHGGQKGVQRPVLSPGTLAPIHPVAFLVITMNRVYGVPISPEMRQIAARSRGILTPATFGLAPEQLSVTVIRPQPTGDGERIADMIGVVVTFEGPPLSAGDIACRLGGTEGFEDVRQMEQQGVSVTQTMEALLGSKNALHNNYQDYQAFLEHGGKVGLQHDPLLPGAYNLNPFLVRVDLAPMLVVEQGQVAVVKAYVGLPTEDVSGEGFKFGSLVNPGHRGIWREPLRTGKYPINPHCYQWEIVPTSILTLNWAEATSQAHKLDARLTQIESKSREGFVFKIDLQVQIHVPDGEAPKVISMVGTMLNLVTEVLQAAVGNHFRDKVQSMEAVEFIQNRHRVQMEAFEYIGGQLTQYRIETKGVYIQDLVFPADLVTVLTARQIAVQQSETYQREKEAQDQRIMMEQAKGTADMQASLAKAQVGVDIARNEAEAKKAAADGEATYIQQTGTAKGAEVRAVGMARAEAYRAQVEALGAVPTAVVNAITALADKQLSFVPNNLVMVNGGAEGASGPLEGLAAMMMGAMGAQGAKMAECGAGKRADAPEQSAGQAPPPLAPGLDEAGPAPSAG
jgi:hypothetical protein